MCNPVLSDVISDKIGDTWPTHLDQLANLREHADNPKFQREFMEAKSQNKRKLAAYLTEKTGRKISKGACIFLKDYFAYEIKQISTNMKQNWKSTLTLLKF